VNGGTPIHQKLSKDLEAEKIKTKNVLKELMERDITQGFEPRDNPHWNYCKNEWQCSNGAENPDHLFYVSANLIPSDQQKPLIPVYVRESYRGICKALMEPSDKKKYLITGTPGIGKSYFAFHFIRYLLNEYNRGEKVSILYQNCHVDMDYHVVLKRSQDNGIVIEHYQGSRVQKVNYLRGEEHVSWYVFDGWHTRNELPQGCDGHTIVITSPDYRNQYKEFSRCSVKLYMPPWDKSEITDLVNLLPNHYNEHKAKQAFRLWGGVVREVLSSSTDGEKELDRAILRCNEDKVTKFVKAFGEVPPDDVSHKVLHQKLKSSMRVDYRKTWIDFASDYVRTQFMEKYISKSTVDTAMKAVENLYRYNNGHQLAGYFFEETVHKHINHGIQYETRYLGMWNDSNSQGPVEAPNLTSGSPKYLTPKFSKTKKTISVNWNASNIFSEQVEKKQYLRPSMPNFPAIDSFILTSHGSLLVLFQITVSEHHQVAVKDLMRIIRELNYYSTPERVRFVFVVYKDIFNAFKLQQPSSGDNDELSKFERIKQYVLKFP
jgi:RHS (Retrotransposon Hot Spot) family protein